MGFLFMLSVSFEPLVTRNVIPTQGFAGSDDPPAPIALIVERYPQTATTARLACQYIATIGRSPCVGAIMSIRALGSLQGLLNLYSMLLNHVTFSGC